MCLSVDEEFKTQKLARAATRKPKIAKEAITVYKRFMIEGRRLRSPYQDFEYKRGGTYEAKSFSYGFFNENSGYCGSLRPRWSIKVYRGLHAYKELSDARVRCNEWSIILQCVIPKGAKYFEGVRGDIVSNKLIIGKRAI